MANKLGRREAALPSDIVRLNNRLATAGSNPPRELLDDDVFYQRTPIDDGQDRALFLRSQRDDMA